MAILINPDTTTNHVFEITPWALEFYNVEKIDFHRINQQVNNGVIGIQEMVKKMHEEDLMRGLSSFHPLVTEDMISLEAMEKNLYPVMFTLEEVRDPNMKKAIDAAIEYNATHKIIEKEENTVDLYNFRQSENVQEQEETVQNKTSTIKDALIEKYTEIFGYYYADEYAPRLRNAQSYICQNQYSSDDFIYIRDESLSHNGKAGMVLTTEAICMNYKNNFTSKFIAKYCDIKRTYIIHDSVLGLDTSSLNIEMKYGSTYQISMGGNFRKFKDFIDYAVSLYAEEDELVW